MDSLCGQEISVAVSGETVKIFVSRKNSCIFVMPVIIGGQLHTFKR